MRRARRTGVALAAVGAALAVAACGSSSGAGGTGTAGGGNTAKADFGLKFSDCMRSHGVSNFPDPTATGQISIGPGSGINPQSPAFQAAQQHCLKLLPKGGAPQPMTAAQRRAAVTFATCMRSHGVPSFPDPLLGRPSGTGPVLSIRGMMFVPGPSFNPAAPAFRQAMGDCGIKPPPQPSG